jgi:hypothetical protein
MKRGRSLELRLVAVVALAGCATTGDSGQGDLGLPTTGMGPFRKLTPEEVKGGSAPFVLEDPRALYREPAVLREGSDTVLFAVARVGDADVIVRTRATDERTFFGTSAQFGVKPLVVLAPDAPWEGALSGPSAVRVGAEVLLYYAGAEGIGVARSADGRAFRKEPGPVLGRDARAGTWETTAPRAPGVYALPDGRLRMLYAAGSSIGEAESADGLAWTRLEGPALGPAPTPPPGSLLPNERPPIDTAAVGDPCVVTRITPAGRFHVRVLYTGTDATGATAIGFAGRYGTTGPLDRQPTPAYSVSQHEAAPAVLELADKTFLYVQQDARSASTTYVGIAAAVAPATVRLPPPADYPDGP